MHVGRCTSVEKWRLLPICLHADLSLTPKYQNDKLHCVCFHLLPIFYKYCQLWYNLCCISNGKIFTLTTGWKMVRKQNGNKRWRRITAVSQTVEQWAIHNLQCYTDRKHLISCLEENASSHSVTEFNKWVIFRKTDSATFLLINTKQNVLEFASLWHLYKLVKQQSAAISLSFSLPSFFLPFSTLLPY